VSEIPLTLDQVLDVLQDEKRYWLNEKAENERQEMMAFGAVGALSNVITVLAMGQPFQWHTSHPLYAVYFPPTPGARDPQTLEPITL